MKWEFYNDRPIYSQLIEQIKLGIISGLFPSGSRLPSVRDLATEAAVNPNTMQRALADLEREGLVHSQRTSGRFITEDATMISQIRDQLAKDKIFAFVEGMKKLGFQTDDIISIMQQGEEK